MRSPLLSLALLATVAAFLAAEGPPAEKPKIDIAEIMKQAHLTPENRGSKNNLDNKVIDGKATGIEQEVLLNLYTQLSLAKPPKGSVDDWENRTREMVDSVKAVMKGEANAGQRLAKARDCKACHDIHRPQE